MKIDIGARVRTSEGEEIGKVEKVIVDPNTNEVESLVVHQGVILTRDSVVPLSLVQGTDRNGVTLRIGREQLKELPDFIERHYVRPPGEQKVPTYPYAPGSVLFPLAPPYGIGGAPSVYQPVEEVQRTPAGTVDVSEGTEVRAVDGPIGVVDEVRTDPLTDRVSSIVVRRGRFLTRVVEIPIEFVDSVAEDHVKLSLTIERVDALPEPVTDRYLTVEGERREEQHPER